MNQTARGFWSRLPVIVALVLAVTMIAGLGAGCRQEQAPVDGLTGSLVLRGSDTLVNLTAAWAEAFMDLHPGVQVSVSGGGSSTGFAALISGSVNLAASSRPIKARERESLEAKGTPAVEHVVALDAVTMIVNPANGVPSLTMAQLADILTGKITNWSRVGGPDRSITIYSRETSSGTYAFVQEVVLKNADFASAARLMPSTQSILEAVAQDAGGIGYVGLGYLTNAVKTVPVASEADSDPVVPSVEAAASGTYPLARPLLFYTAGAPGELTQTFLEFAVSRAGKAITEEMGFVPPSEGN